LESGILNLSQENHLNKEVFMKNLYKKLAKGEEIFVGIDLHKKTWHVTIRTKKLSFFWEELLGFAHRRYVDFCSTRKKSNFSLDGIVYSLTKGLLMSVPVFGG
jgi:hypothetical protein